MDVNRREKCYRGDATHEYPQRREQDLGQGQYFEVGSRLEYGCESLVQFIDFPRCIERIKLVIKTYIASQ